MDTMISTMIKLYQFQFAKQAGVISITII